MVLLNLVFLRILAISLIVNSHLGVLYPISGLSTGGRLGNSLFYFLSGVGLSISFQRNPIPALEWVKKRGIKLLIPLILYFGIVNIGNLQGFVDAVLNNLVWHKQDQLERFIPVLLGLYVLFLPINNLAKEKIKIFLVSLTVISAVLLIYRVNVTENILVSLPSEDIYFALNALMCFILGILMTRDTRIECMLKSNRRRNIVLSFLLVLLSQGGHLFLKYTGGKYIVLDFYINFFTVISLYVFLSLIDFSKLKNYTSFFYDIASSSLAVFIIHFKIITVISLSGIKFPFNVISVFLYSFIFSYGLSRLAINISNYILKKITITKDKRDLDACNRNE